jgi:hypothetical protein
LLAVYWGGELTGPEVEHLADAVKTRFSHLEAEVVYGGQPHYDVVASLE